MGQESSHSIHMRMLVTLRVPLPAEFRQNMPARNNCRVFVLAERSNIEVGNMSPVLVSVSVPSALIDEIELGTSASW